MEQKNTFDSRTMIVILICFGIWWAWEKYLEKKYPETMGAKSAIGQQQRPLPQPESPAAVPKEKAEQKLEQAAQPQETRPEQFWSYDDAEWKVTVSSHGGKISEVVLKKYTDREGKPIVLLSKDLPGFLLTSVDGPANLKNISQADYTIKPISDTVVELSTQSAGTTLTKTLSFVPSKYIVHADVEISGQTTGIRHVDVEIEQSAPAATESSAGSSFFRRSAGQELQEFFFNHGTKNNRHLVTAKDPVQKDYDQTNFAALGSRYFTTLLFNRGSVLPQGSAFPKGPNSTLKLTYPVLEDKGNVKINLDMYAGPKVLNQLQGLDESAGQVVDFGYFSWIAIPLLKLMKALFEVFKNYGVAIIVLTLLVRLLTFPFTYMSYKSMKAMQTIQPEIQRLKVVYKDNSAQLNQEMMKLMRENKVNPMGGCLPMLLQLPIFWALYQVLQNSIELYHSPFAGWIHDLSLKDPFYVLPVLMGATMLIQQKLTPTTMDPAQAKVMLIMPIFFTFLMASLPSGLTLYIFVSTLFGIFQQVFIMGNRGAAPVQAVVRRT